MVDASFGSWAAGDSYLVYPTGNPSWRFLELRNGIVAAEKFWLLAKERDLEGKRLDLLQKCFDVKASVAGTLDVLAAREAVERIVNEP